MSVYMTKEAERRIEELKHYSTKTIFYGLKDRKNFRPRIVFKEKMFTNTFSKVLFYPLYKSYKKRLDADLKAVEEIRECAKVLRQRDVQLKVLLRTNDVRDEIDLISFLSQSGYSGDDCFELYIRNLFYANNVLPMKRIMLKNVDHVLKSKTLDTDRSSRYLTLLQYIKETLEDDIEKGGRSK